MTPRTIVIRRSEAGRTVAEILRATGSLSWSAVGRLMSAGQVWLNGSVCHQPAQRVRAGQRLEIKGPERRKRKQPGGSGSAPHHEPPTRRHSAKPAAKDFAVEIRFVDSHIVVAEKPAGLTTVRHAGETAAFGARARRFLPPTLVDLLPGMLPKTAGRLRAVHRLDKETSGLVILARTAQAERHLGLQFRAHTIDRRYLAVVRGKAKGERIESLLLTDRGDGRRGSNPDGGDGQRAVTHVRVIDELGDYTLVECRLETGRTHQVRIHLGERGIPLCGDRVYDRPLHGAPLPDGSGFSRPALHAALLAIDHPASGKRMTWTSDLPTDMRELVGQLRKRK